ncbi:MAG: homoprotocatechuate degradation operon regulator HpaR [Pseudomonadota bacterium]
MNSKLPATDRSLPIALMRAREQVMAPIRDMLVDTGLSEQQWRVLRVLAEHGEMDSKTLATRACLLFPSLTRMASAMSKKGLITQARDNADKRRQLLAITPAGASIINDNAQRALEIVDGFREILGDTDYERLLDLLARLGDGQKDLN